MHFNTPNLFHPHLSETYPGCHRLVLSLSIYLVLPTEPMAQTTSDKAFEKQPPPGLKSTDPVACFLYRALVDPRRLELARLDVQKQKLDIWHASIDDPLQGWYLKAEFYELYVKFAQKQKPNPTQQLVPRKRFFDQVFRRIPVASHKKDRQRIGKKQHSCFFLPGLALTRDSFKDALISDDLQDEPYPVPAAARVKKRKLPTAVSGIQGHFEDLRNETQSLRKKLVVQHKEHVRQKKVEAQIALKRREKEVKKVTDSFRKQLQAQQTRHEDEVRQLAKSLKEEMKQLTGSLREEAQAQCREHMREQEAQRAEHRQLKRLVDSLRQELEAQRSEQIRQKQGGEAQQLKQTQELVQLQSDLKVLMAQYKEKLRLLQPMVKKALKMQFGRLDGGGLEKHTKRLESIEERIGQLQAEYSAHSEHASQLEQRMVHWQPTVEEGMEKHTTRLESLEERMGQVQTEYKTLSGHTSRLEERTIQSGLEQEVDALKAVMEKRTGQLELFLKRVVTSLTKYKSKMERLELATVKLMKEHETQKEQQLQQAQQVQHTQQTQHVYGTTPASAQPVYSYVPAQPTYTQPAQNQPTYYVLHQPNTSSSD